MKNIRLYNKNEMRNEILYGTIELRLDGWLQSCLICNNLTSNIVENKFKDLCIEIYLCVKCKKKRNISDLIFNNYKYKNLLKKYNII